MSLTPRGMSIQEAYRLYASSKLSVNRRYQRKLVWSSKEKMHLIDSVQNELPIPLFMFAKFDDEDDRLEIIDGMQRLAVHKGAPDGSWFQRMLERKPRMVVAVALANKMARRLWAMLVKNEDYRDPAIAAA